MSHWNYRVIRHPRENGDVNWAIHEVYYNNAGQVVGWSENPVSVDVESEMDDRKDDASALEIVAKQLEWMSEALKKPILNVSELLDAGADE